MECRICSGLDLELVIDLGNQPWGNNFLTREQVGKEPFYPLRVVQCLHCSAVQLDYTVKKEIMFADHTYLSGVTLTLDKHFGKIADEVTSRFFASKRRKAALDIGSNDGTQLIHYKRLNYEVLGVESSLMPFQKAMCRGINTVHAFFNLQTAKTINERFEVINASGVFFHLEELHSVCEGIKFCLAEDGVFVVQFLYLKAIVENCAFDQIYHEHLLYYTLTTLNTLLHSHGIELFDAYFSPIHGGSLIGFASHRNKYAKTNRLSELLIEEEKSNCNSLNYIQHFSAKIEKMKRINIDFLSKSRAQGKRIFGMGAPVKGNTLLNYFQIGPDIVEVLVEKNALRAGLFSPGMHIPIVIEGEWPHTPDIYYVLAWNFRTEILANNKVLIDRGVEFFFPVMAPGS